MTDSEKNVHCEILTRGSTRNMGCRIARNPLIVPQRTVISTVCTSDTMLWTLNEIVI